MKNIFTLFSAVFMSFAVIAAPPRAKTLLTIHSHERGDMKVVIDGRRFEPRHNTMRLQGLRPGYHKVKIYRERRGGFFNLSGKRYELVFNKSINVRPRTNLTITLERFGRVSVKETRFDGYSRNNPRYREFDDRHADRNRDHEDRNRDYDDRIWGDDFEEGQDFEFDRDGGNGDYDFDDRGDHDHFRPTMNDREFNRVLESINTEWLETNKMKSASQVISTNYLTSLQVKQMMMLFSFENNRVDIAKQAFAKTVDQGNFMETIDDALNYSSSREELARHVRR